MAALKGSISGDSFDLPLPDSLLHPLERLAPSGPWVFPHPNVWRNKVHLLGSNTHKRFCFEAGLQYETDAES